MKKADMFQKVMKDYKVELIRNEEKSKRAGYDIYDMFKQEGEDTNSCGWVSDLGDRLEINEPNGQSTNAWFSSDFNRDTFSYLLANWLKPYTEEVINKVLEKVSLIEKDNTSVKLLFRLNKEANNNLKYLQAGIYRNIEHGLTVVRDCLSKEESIRDVLRILWFE